MIARQAEIMIEILKKENAYYKDLLALSTKKRAIVIEGKVNELDKIVKFEQNMIIDLGQLEKTREQELQKLCGMLQLDGKATISELIKQLPEPQSGELQALQVEMSNTIKELQNVNETNGTLIQQSLEYIEYSVNMITSTGTANSLYDDIKGIGKDVNDKKRLFDTKV